MEIELDVNEIEVVEKVVENRKLVGIKFYIVSDFNHGIEFITFWGQRSLKVNLEKALLLLS